MTDPGSAGVASAAVPANRPSLPCSRATVAWNGRVEVPNFTSVRRSCNPAGALGTSSGNWSSIYTGAAAHTGSATGTNGA